MGPIVRRGREPFTETVGRQASAFNVVVNGDYCDVTLWGKMMAGAGYADPAGSTVIEGEVVAKGRVVAGDSRPERFFLAEVVNHLRRTPKDPPYVFETGRGDPPTGPDVVAALGNLGPMIGGGLRYGVGNRYRPPAKGPLVGDPGPKLRPSLVQRNDNTFASVERRDSRTGKTIIAWHERAGALLVGVEGNAAPGRPGESYSRLTLMLAAAGFTDAVFCDGSDSAMLWYRGRLIVAPAERKADTMTVGLGFQTSPAPHRHAPPRTPPHRPTR